MQDDPISGNDRPGAGAEPQPWHAADEKRPARDGAPVGTHSLTGGGAQVGMPTSPKADAPAERGDPTREQPAAQPDPLAEPRAGSADVQGHRP